MRGVARSYGTTMDKKQRFGARLKTIRKSRGLTQEGLGQQIGRSTETISQLERGVIYPGLDTAEALATALSVSLDDLVLGGGSQNPRSEVPLSECMLLLRDMDDRKLSIALSQIRALAEADI